jgi:N-acetylmuramoyl-L-alanine amidase
MAKLRIVGVSAGHNSADPGSSLGPTTERSITERWADKICRALGARWGIATVAPPNAHLSTKVEYFNRTRPEAIVEIHFNANIPVTGCETLYFPGSSAGRRLASKVHKAYSPFTSNRDRGVKEGWFRMDAPGIKEHAQDVEGDEQPLYLLKRTRAPTIIIEPEFISQMENILAMEDKVCQAIAYGLNDYLRN